MLGNIADHRSARFCCGESTQQRALAPAESAPALWNQPGGVENSPEDHFSMRKNRIMAKVFVLVFW
jgi:hypothetical protein